MQNPQKHGSLGFCLLLKITPSDMFPNFKIVAFILMYIQYINQTIKAFTVA